MAASEDHTVLDRPTFDKPVKVLIVVSPYYSDIAEGLLTGAKAELDAAGATYEVVEMPGELVQRLRPDHQGFAVTIIQILTSRDDAKQKS